MHSGRCFLFFLAVAVLLIGGTTRAHAYAPRPSTQAIPSSPILHVAAKCTYPVEEIHLTLETQIGLFASGDPINRLDPDGRLGKSLQNGHADGWANGNAILGPNNLGNLASSPNKLGYVLGKDYGTIAGIANGALQLPGYLLGGAASWAGISQGDQNAAQAALFMFTPLSAATKTTALAADTRAVTTAAKTGVSIGEDLSSAAGTRAWRHVPEGHPALAAAQQGVIRPYGATMEAPLDVRALAHDTGYTQGSGLTSWTADQAWALARQQRMGGVVLETVAPESSFWFNQAAKGVESQILIPGVVKPR
jgi:hypothetical protein